MRPLYFILFESYDDEGAHYLEARITTLRLTPPEATPLITDLNTIENHLSTYATLLAYSSVSDTELCDMYFSGMLIHPDCVEGRQNLLDYGMSNNVVP